MSDFSKLADELKAAVDKVSQAEAKVKSTQLAYESASKEHSDAKVLAASLHEKLAELLPAGVVKSASKHLSV